MAGILWMSWEGVDFHPQQSPLQSQTEFLLSEYDSQLAYISPILPCLILSLPIMQSVQHFQRMFLHGLEMMRRKFLLIAGLLVLMPIGCHSLPLSRQQPPPTNPIQVRANNYDLVWERTIDTLHEYQFEIAKENRLSGEIETEYKTGASILEPWHFDAANAKERWEGSLQSIRRRLQVQITQVEDGYLISVEAFKELEDLPGLASNSPAGATFRESEPLKRDLNLVVGQTTPSGWIFRGRDQALEQAVLADLIKNFQGR